MNQKQQQKERRRGENLWGDAFWPVVVATNHAGKKAIRQATVISHLIDPQLHMIAQVITMILNMALDNNDNYCRQQQQPTPRRRRGRRHDDHGHSWVWHSNQAKINTTPQSTNE
jgi:hypothetical protein